MLQWPAIFDRYRHLSDFDQTARDRILCQAAVWISRLNIIHCLESIAPWQLGAESDSANFRGFEGVCFGVFFRHMEQFEAITHVDDDLILVAMDHGSTNGTFINKSRLEKALVYHFGASL